MLVQCLNYWQTFDYQHIAFYDYSHPANLDEAGRPHDHVEAEGAAAHRPQEVLVALTGDQLVAAGQTGLREAPGAGKGELPAKLDRDFVWPSWKWNFFFGQIFRYSCDIILSRPSFLHFPEGFRKFQLYIFEADLPMVCGGTSSDAGVAWAVSVWTEHVEASDQAHLSALAVPCLVTNWLCYNYFPLSRYNTFLWETSYSLTITPLMLYLLYPVKTQRKVRWIFWYSYALFPWYPLVLWCAPKSDIAFLTQSNCLDAYPIFTHIPPNWRAATSFISTSIP